MIEQGHASIDEFERKLRTLGPADVRLLVHRAGEERSLVTVVVNAGLDTTAIAEETYDYGEVAFVKAVLDGDDVADLLMGGSAEVGGLKFTVPAPTPSCSWNRRESRTHADHGTLFTTPHTDYRVDSQSRKDPPWPGTVLAGAGLPFFPDVNVAAASILFDVYSMPGGRTIPSEMMLVRIAHPEAYFEQLRVSSAAIVASVLGEALDDVCLQVSSAGGRHEECVGEPRDIRVSVNGADTNNAWVALTRGQECLDFRAISSRWPNSIAQRDILYEPDDLNERIDLMRRNGENATVEFKEAIPKGDGIPRAVAAFANGNGGTILIGIEDRTGAIVGVADAATCLDGLVDVIRSKVRPSPKFEPFTCTLQGRTVVAVRVEPGDDRPYGVTGKGGPRYYVRRGATNRGAESEEMRVIACPRQSDSQESFLHWD